jgi:HD superfamily phosphodiesterase
VKLYTGLNTKISKFVALLMFYYQPSGMHSIDYTIKSVENKWLTILTGKVESIFKNTFLPSHDLQHHLRVWEYAKRLLIAYEGQNIVFSAEKIEALMLAVFFHDTGLTITIDSSHGEAGSAIALEFIKSLKENWKNEYTSELLEAIVKHDDKEYSDSIAEDKTHGIYEILTVADDIDALGCLGLVRYYEIYFNRNIPETTITEKIKVNLTSRFEFISKQISHLPEYYQLQKSRYEKSIKHLSYLNKDDIFELREIVERKIDPLNLEPHTLVNRNLAELIQKAQKEI